MWNESISVPLFPLVSSSLTLAFVKAWKLVAVLGKKVSTYVNNGIINHALLQTYVNTIEKGQPFGPFHVQRFLAFVKGSQIGQDLIY